MQHDRTVTSVLLRRALAPVALPHIFFDTRNRFVVIPKAATIISHANKRVCLFVEGRGSRATGRGSRVNSRGSRVYGRGSRVEGN